MDVVTLGAALSIMKKMPDTAASSAAAAEDAADRAEEAAQAAARSAQAAAEVESKTNILQQAVTQMQMLISQKADNGYADSQGYLHLTSNGDDISGGIGPFATNGGGTQINAVFTARNASGWISKTIATGDECRIAVEWSSIEEEMETGSGTLKIYTGSMASVPKATLEVPQGLVSVDLASLKGCLSVGDNLVIVTIADIYGQNTRFSMSVSVTETYMTTSFRRYHDEDGTLLKTVECHDGVPQSGPPTGMSKANSADGHYSYTFAGWSKTQGSATPDDDALDNVIADRDLYAVYTATVRTYTATWKNSNGVVLETDTNVPWGTTPAYNGATPQNPTSGGGSFTAWTPAPGPITGDTNYIATYTPVYNVYFYNGSTLLDTVQVLQGGSASYTGATPQKTGVADPSVFEFTGWSPSPTNVQGNLSVYAQFRQTAAAWETPGFDVTGAYAVQWHYGLTMPQLSRGGLAASFTDPVPAEGASGIGSSPFDSIAPWNGMEIYVDANGTPQKYAAGMSLTENDILVKIPEFYYKVEKDTTKQMWTWAVSPTAKTGYEKHPGSGRYVGRYHTGGSSSGVYSRSGVSPLVNTSQTNFRTYSANKGTGWHMMDLATWSAIQLLYLVEFADFDSQTVLGKGWNTGSIGSMGGTDSASYHTVKATGAHNQYRNIEDPFSNCYDWIDGFVGSNNSDTYAAAKDSYAGGNSDLTALGFKLPSSGAIRGFGYSAAAPWAFIPDTASGTDYTTYVCDRVVSSSSLCPAYVGGCYYDDALFGFFYFAANYSASGAYGYLGSRLLKT